MKTKDLIKILQDMVDKHEEHVPIMGEHEVMIDTWQKTDTGSWMYTGFSNNIEIDKSSDGVYDILVAKESWA